MGSYVLHVEVLAGDSADLPTVLDFGEFLGELLPELLGEKVLNRRERILVE